MAGIDEWRGLFYKTFLVAHILQSKLECLPLASIFDLVNSSFLKQTRILVYR
jgi:hypothetical protein